LGIWAVGSGANVNRAGRNVSIGFAAEYSHLSASVKFVMTSSILDSHPSGNIIGVGNGFSVARTEAARPIMMANLMVPRELKRGYVIAEFVRQELET